MWRFIRSGVLVGMLSGLAGQAAALCNCYLPASPDIPDGQTASDEQIQFARNTLVAYQDKMRSYKQCLERCIVDASDAENVVVQQWNQTVLDYNNRVSAP